jgi:hypothetical protein
MENLKTFYENTIIENIDFEGYGINNDCYLYDKIKTLYNIFKKEYVHENNKHINEIILFRDWLQGLPSVLTVPFYNYDILQNAKKANLLNLDNLSEKSKELKEDQFLAQYWINLSKAFFTLKNNL